jgi:hypothetical protein
VSDVTHDKHDETTGKFAAEYSAEDFVDAVTALDLPTTSDVADAVGCAHRTALHHLNRLEEEEGRLDSRMAGRAKLWYVVAGGDDVGVTATTDDEGVVPDRTRERGSTERLIDINALSFDRDLTDPRRTHLEAWIRHAAGEDGVSKSDFKHWWTEDRHTETGYNAGSFWEAFAKAAMKQSDRFTKPNARTYRYTGAADP